MLRPLPRRVAIMLIPDPNKSKGGIIIPDEAKERADQGIIKYLGDDCDEFEVGDYVLFSGYSGTNVSVEGEGNVTIMLKSDIVCKLDPPNTQVPGLYYRDKKGWSGLEENIADILKKFFKDDPINIKNAAELLTVAVAANHPYFNADYETVISLAGQAYQDHPYHRTTRIGYTHGSKKDFRKV